MFGQSVLDREGHGKEDVHGVQDEDGWGDTALIDPGLRHETFGQGAQRVALATSSLAHDVEHVGAPHVHPNVAIARFGVLADEDCVDVGRRGILADKKAIVVHEVAGQCWQRSEFVR